MGREERGAVGDEQRIGLDRGFEVVPDGQGRGVGQHRRDGRAAAIGSDQNRHLLLGAAALLGDAAPLARLAVELFGTLAAGQHISLVGLHDALQLDGSKNLPVRPRVG